MFGVPIVIFATREKKLEQPKLKSQKKSNASRHTS